MGMVPTVEAGRSARILSSLTCPRKLLILMMLLGGPSLLRAEGLIRIIAVDEGQGTTDGTSYSAFTNPVLNESGQAAFVGFRVLGASGSPPLAGGIHVGDGHGPLMELVRVGDPGFVPDSFANGFTVEAINDVGQVACFENAVSAAGDTIASGLFLRKAATEPILAVLRGAPDPDGDPINQIQFTDLDVNGRIGLSLSHPQANSPNALISTAVYEAGGLRVLAKQGGPAPDGIGTVGAAFYPSLNDAGQINFDVRVARPGLSQRPAFFRETPGVGLELLLRSQDPATAPGIDGTILVEFYTSSMNGAGLIIFAGNVTGATDPANNGRGLFVVGAPNAATALIREGRPVPGGTTIAAFGRPSLNQSGAAAFHALLTDDPAAEPDRTKVGIYRQSAAGLTEIARDGQSSPAGDGMIDLPSFGLPITSPSYHIRPLFNDAGQVAFRANLAGTGSGGAASHAIFFFDDALGLIEVARTGSPLLGSTIVNLGLRQSNLSDSYEEVGFNGAGQIAFRFALGDGREGVAIWSPASPAASFKLTITRATPPATGYDFKWDCRPGKVYDLVTSTDLATPISGWPVYDPAGGGGNDPYRNISAAGSTITLTGVPSSGPKRFFAVVEKDAPP